MTMAIRLRVDRFSHSTSSLSPMGYICGEIRELLAFFFPTLRLPPFRVQELGSELYGIIFSRQTISGRVDCSQ